MKNTNTIHPVRRALFVCLLLLVSMSGGFLGGMITQERVFFDDISQIGFAQRDTVIIDDRTRRVSDNIKTDSGEVLNAVSQSMLEFYESPKKGVDRKFPENIFTTDSFLGYGLAFTSDGWIVGPRSILNSSITDIVAIDSEKNVYKIEKKILDPVLDVSYLKITSSRIRPVEFLKDSSVLEGRHAYYVSDRHTIASLDVSGPSYPPYKNTLAAVQSASLLQKMYNSGMSFAAEGSPIVNDDKKIIGITASQGIIPGHYIQYALDRVLRAEKKLRPTLSLQYVDNAWLIPTPTLEKKARIATGATVVSMKRNQDTVLKSPTGSVRLVSGDVILSVNDENIDGNRSLSEIVLQYKVGDTVVLKVNHLGTIVSYSIILE